MYVWSDKEKNWNNTGKVQGPKGDSEPNTIRAAYLVTFNGNEPKIGITVNSNGILPIERKEFELVNIGNKSICLITPNIENIKSKSYFTNSLVTVFIEYLGKQVI